MGKITRKVLTFLYIAFILYITIFSRTVGAERIFRGLFWELSNGYWKDIFLNFLLFVPLGFLLGKKGLVVGVVLSVFIECAQYVYVLGWCQVDDVLNNTIGTVTGTIILGITSNIISKLNNKELKKRT